MSNDQGVQVNLNNFEPILFSTIKGEDLCFPVIVEPLGVNEITGSVTNMFKIIAVDYCRKGIALQVYYTPELVQKHNLFFDRLKQILPYHLLLPGTFLSIRGDNWEYELHPPIAAALLIVGRDGLLYLKRDGEERKELNPSFVAESIVVIAMKIRSVYEDIEKESN